MKTREPSEQDWPVERNPPCTATVNAFSTSQSAKNMCGFLPPHSNEHRLRLTAADCMIFWAVRCSPVNEIFWTFGWAVSAAPAIWPYPGTTLTTPGGKPASSINLANASVLTGVCSAGLRMMALPAANAGPSFQQHSEMGEFQGRIAATTPTGS